MPFQNEYIELHHVHRATLLSFARATLRFSTGTSFDYIETMI